MVTQKAYDRVLTYDSTKVGLMLAKDRNGRFLWDVVPAPLLAPSYNPGQASYLNYSPVDDMVFEENDWRRGLVSGGYGGDDRFLGRIFAPPKVHDTTPTQPVVANGSFEDGDPPTDWTASAGVLSRSDEQVKSGAYSAKHITTGAGDNVYQEISNSSKLIGLTVKVYCWVYAPAAGKAYIQIEDSNGTTDGSQNTGTGWEQLSCTRNIMSGAGAITIRLMCTAAVTLYWDFLSRASYIYGTPVAFAVFKGDLYLASAQSVLKFDATAGTWDGMFGTTDVITDLCNYAETYLMVARYTGKYYYSSDGSSYTLSTLGDGYAYRFASVVATGGETLWKSHGLPVAREIKSSTDPSNTGSWTGATNIGWSTTAIQRLLGYQEALYVFKPEGMYLYDGANWVPASRELESLYSTYSGLGSYGWKNRIYMPMGANAIYHYTPLTGTLDTITPSMYAPSEADFRGRAITFAADEEFLFAFLDNGSNVEILAGRWETIGGTTDFWWHPLVTLTGWTVVPALVTSVATNKRLWFAGTYGGDKVPGYIILPDKYGDVPSASGYKFDTGWIHYTPKYTGFFLDIPKVWLSLVLKTSNLLADTRTILAEYSVDGGDWTNIGDTVALSTFDTSPIQTRYLKPSLNGVEGKEIRLRFTGTNGEDVTPIIEGFALHGLLRPPAKKEFRFSVRVANNLQLRNGTVDITQTAKSIATALRAAYRSLPVDLVDEWGTTHKVVLLNPPLEASVIDESGRVQEEVFTLTCREVTLS